MHDDLSELWTLYYNMRHRAQQQQVLIDETHDWVTKSVRGHTSLIYLKGIGYRYSLSMT